MKTLVLALATTALTASAALAAGISTADTNGDRFISKAEVAAQYPTLDANDFRNVDTNRDGRWSSKEYNTGLAREVIALHVASPGGVQDLATLDVDGSGFVSEAELKAAYVGLTSVDFDLIDLNNDNRVSAVELYDAENQVRISRHDETAGSVLVALDVLDTDNSGFASISELSAQYANLSEVDFDLIDQNNDNRISFNELYDIETVEILGKNR